MKQEVKQVNKADYMPIYNRIPEFKKRECVNYMGFTNPSYLTNRKSINIDMYNKLLQFVSHYDFGSPNTIKEYLPFDSFEVQPHLAGIIGLINSVDYKLLTDIKRTKLINYYKDKQAELSQESFN
jgi:hypothetical protein